MKRIKSNHHGTLSELNITPLLDLVFVLLVIFIITTPQMMNNLEMALPSAKPPPVRPNQPKPVIHKIAVDANGQIKLDGRVADMAVLKNQLTGLKTSEPDLRVVVDGSDDVDYQTMVNVLDLLRFLEITKVGLATEPGK